jgi:hypothetical protein
MPVEAEAVHSVVFLEQVEQVAVEMETIPVPVTVIPVLLTLVEVAVELVISVEVAERVDQGS